MERILIVDFGSQVTQLIARRVRESGVYCELVPFDKAQTAFAEVAPQAVILSGGPAVLSGGVEANMSAEAPTIPQNILTSGVPLLGICYGQQAMCVKLGGAVESSAKR